MDQKILHLFLEDDSLNFNVIENIVQDLVRPIPMLEVTEREKRLRNHTYFEVIIPNYTDIHFIEHFRMSRESAEVFANILANKLPNADQMAPLRKKLLFCIWVLSKNESYLAASERFDLPKSTGYRIFSQMMYSISSLLPQFVVWPDVGSYEGTVDIFYIRSRGFPGIVGAIDICHIPCKQPVGNEIDTHNRKASHSIVLQGTCDNRGKFIDVCIGSPGIMQNAEIFRNSLLFEKLAEPNFVPQNFHLLGDATYPLIVNLMTPFRNNGHLTRAQLKYNTKLNSARSIIDRAFGHLKEKFRRLTYLDTSNFDLGKNMIAAACILHNFIIDQNTDDIEHYINVMNEPSKNIILNEEGHNMPNLDPVAVQKRNNIVALFQ